jgi:phage/plasmid-associated DNA primase
MSEGNDIPDSYKILLATKTVQNKMKGGGNSKFKNEERIESLYNLVFGLSFQSNGDDNKRMKILDIATTLQTKFSDVLPEEEFRHTFEEAMKKGDEARTLSNSINDKKASEISLAASVIHDAMVAKHLPVYVYEIVEQDKPTGEFAIDFKRYSKYLKDIFHIVNFKNLIYIYDPSLFVHRLQVNEIHTHARNTYVEYNIKGLFQSVVRETDVHIKSMGNEPDYPFVGKPGLLNVKNGVVDLKTGVIQEHDPNILFDYVIWTPYNIFSETPELDSFLNQYGNTEVISVLAKSLWQRGYIDTLKEFTVFFGDRDCGKTTAAELIQSTIDGDLNSKRNTSRTLLNDMLQRFGYSGMENKIINIGDDLPDMFVKNTGRINELVGSVHHDIEKKGIDRYHGVVTAYHLFTTNNLPPLDDDDMVIWSKIRLVEFKNRFDRGSVRENLYTDLIKEQLLFRAIELVKSWQQTPYKNDQSAEEVRKIWHEASSDVELFIAECVSFDPGGFEKLDSVKFAYEEWCKIGGRRRHMKHLTKQLQAYMSRRAEGNGYMLKIKNAEKKDNPSEVILDDFMNNFKNSCGRNGSKNQT